PERVGAVGGGFHVVAVAPERDGEHVAHHAVVFDDQDHGADHDKSTSPATSSEVRETWGTAAGSVNSTTAPPPAFSRTQTRPPCARTIARQMVRPSPAPPSLLPASRPR